jgi:hypothetical protein
MEFSVRLNYKNVLQKMQAYLFTVLNLEWISLTSFCNSIALINLKKVGVKIIARYGNSCKIAFTAK